MIEYAGTKRQTNTSPAYWKCICDCGNIVVVCGNSLRSGATTSCGCYRIEQSIVRGKENGWKHLRLANIGHNAYDLSGDYGIGYDQKGNKFIFDKEDYDKIKDVYWAMTNKGYFVHAEHGVPLMRLHKTIMGDIPNGMVVDHISGDRSDNRKSNLRFATFQQNTFNSHRKPTLSGCVGVTKRGNKWRARIRFCDELICLGDYSDLDEAIRARLMAEKKYFGEFSPQMDMIKKYKI